MEHSTLGDKGLCKLRGRFFGEVTGAKLSRTIYSPCVKVSLLGHDKAEFVAYCYLLGFSVNFLNSVGRKELSKGARSPKVERACVF